MSVAHRSIARLPVHLFEDLATCSSYCHNHRYPPTANSSAADSNNNNSFDPLTLRDAIVKQLQRVPRRKRFRTVYEQVSTVGPLLQLPPTTLMRALDPLLTYAECLELKKRVAEHCAPQPVSALELLRSTQENDASLEQQQQNTTTITRHFTTGLTNLDRIIKGGLRVGTLTELVGKAGSGKTQLAMQTAICAALLHRAGTIYVDTERKLSLTRLQEIATQQQRQQQFQGQSLAQPSSSFSSSCFPPPAAVLENLTVHTANSMSELETTFGSLEEEIFLRSSSEQQFPVRLLVVDSIAAPARRDVASNAQRAIAVMQCAQRLKRLADQFQLAVLIINQVDSSSSSNTFVKDRAALGTAWHHCVTTRIQLEQHTTATSVAVPPSAALTRTASVVKSNTVPAGTVSFAINNSGLVGSERTHCDVQE